MSLDNCCILLNLQTNRLSQNTCKLSIRTDKVCHINYFSKFSTCLRLHYWCIKQNNLNLILQMSKYSIPKISDAEKCRLHIFVSRILNTNYAIVPLLISCTTCFLMSVIIWTNKYILLSTWFDWTIFPNSSTLGVFLASSFLASKTFNSLEDFPAAQTALSKT